MFTQRSTSPTLILATGIAIILVASLGIFYALMRPERSDLQLMAQLLALTAGVSVLFGFGAYRLGWLERAPSLRSALVGTYLLASGLTFLNVWITARLMFASEHDLLLATVLLFFAGGIAVALGSFFAHALTGRIARLEDAARKIQSGELSERVNVGGTDEIAALGNAFNQMADRLQSAQQKQKELEAMRRDLVAWAGHDLRTPLTSIQVLVEALSDGVVDDPESTRKYLLQAKKQVDILSLLVNDLFQVSQLDAGGLPLQFEIASLTDLISDTLESFSGQAEQRQVHLSGFAAPDIDPLSFDVQHMGRVLNNLVSNALRYTPPGGSVFIQAERLPGKVVITIRDTGEGIAPEDLPHVFERFYRGEKSRSRASGGAGLGLAIVKGIVEAHGGTISVKSIPEAGTDFTFTLPKA
jgi:signal transduction histidine kinase